jgi:hypothetical protein
MAAVAVIKKVVVLPKEVHRAPAIMLASKAQMLSQEV